MHRHFIRPTTPFLYIMTPNTKQTLRRVIAITIIASISLWMLGGIAQMYNQATSEIYMPIVRLDPTPTPTHTPTPALTPTPVCQPSNTIPSINPTLEQAIVTRIQQARFDRGLATLTQPWQLGQVAIAHAQDMRINNFVGHQGTDGRYAQERMRANCYFPAADQEIVWGGNTDDADAIIASWLADENWEKAMMDGKMNDLGVGYALGSSSNTFDHYFAVNLGAALTADVAADRTPACELTLENQYGRGSWRIYNIEICQDLGLK